MDLIATTSVRKRPPPRHLARFTCGPSRTEAEHHQPRFDLLIAMHQGALNASHAGSAPQSKSKRAAFSQELPSALVSPCEATQSGAQ